MFVCVVGCFLCGCLLASVVPRGAESYSFVLIGVRLRRHVNSKVDRIISDLALEHCFSEEMALTFSEYLIHRTRT